MSLTKAQFEVLMSPLKAHRVSQRKQAGHNLSYLEAWDVKAHLTRVFGFCNWDGEVLACDLAFEDAPEGENKNYRIGYRVVYRLKIRDEDGCLLCTHTEAAVGFASLPQRGEAHDMAIKTAESDALKRAAINLGTQFGLSLYDRGSLKDVIGMTLVHPQEAGNVAPEALPERSEGTEGAKPDIPSEVVNAFASMAEMTDSEARILGVASAKVEHAEWLNMTLHIDGEGDITLGRYADLVAGGKYLNA